MRVVGALLAAGWLALGCVDGAEVPSRAVDHLVLLHTSDLHSRVWPFRARLTGVDAELGLGPRGALVELGGWARLATLLERQRAEGAELWLDSGDALEGAAIFRRYDGEVELSLLDEMGLSAMALGNHELALPAASLAELFTTRARFPVLSSNLTPALGSTLAGRVLPSAVLVSQGVRVGLVGVANPESPPNVAQATNPWALEVGDTAAALQLELQWLSPLVDVLVVLSHLGLDADRELVAATFGVDLVLGGHQHIVTLEPEWQRDQRGREVPIVHSGAYGKVLSRLDLALVPDRSGPGKELGRVALQQLPAGADVPEHATLLARLEPLSLAPDPPLAYALESLPRRSALGGDSALGNLVADAMREVAGADVALINRSALRTDLEAGLVLSSDVELALPFDEPWRVVWARAGQLGVAIEASARRASGDCASPLDVSGVRLVLDCAACAQRATGCLRWWQVTPWGEVPLQGSELLRVTLPEYLLRPGAELERLGSGAALSHGAAEVVTRHLARLPSGPDGRDACVEDLRRLSPQRCREAFGLEGCPMDGARARESCGALPRLRGARDGRITMLL